MKKQILLIALSVVAIGFSAFTGKDKKSTLSVNVDESNVVWLGKKVTGEHIGNINIAHGDLEFVGEHLRGGTFEIDMKSITNTDLKDAEYNKKLVGHLKSDDFFGVEKFPKTTFVINKVKHEAGNKYHVKGDITIKGITKSIEFPVEVSLNGSKATISAAITIDRTEFDVKYGSGSFFENLGDKMIYDDFTLDVTLVANK
ncbi:MAG: YceI family protein [Cyclobacteriaceae bacterium]|nr:YceI family protein [Cyclobacteriaceae bacterium]